VKVCEWGPVSRGVGSALPDPVWWLLRVWRTQPASNTERTRSLASLERADYRMLALPPRPESFEVEARPVLGELEIRSSFGAGRGTSTQAPAALGTISV
jgi:hypothetical protein